MAATSTVATGALRSSRRGHDESPGSMLFLGLLWLSLALAIVFLMTLIVSTAVDGADRFDAALMTAYSSKLTTDTIGLRAARLGTRSEE